MVRWNPSSTNLEEYLGVPWELGPTLLSCCTVVRDCWHLLLGGEWGSHSGGITWEPLLEKGTCRRDQQVTLRVSKKEKYLCGAVGDIQCVGCPAVVLVGLQRDYCPEQPMMWQVFLWMSYSGTGNTGCWLKFTLQGRMTAICLCILLQFQILPTPSACFPSEH